MPPPDAVPVTSGVLRDRPLPEEGSDKESRGRVLVVGGSDQTPGAVLLAPEAVLRSGAGKLRVATVESMAPLVAVALPEARVAPLPQTSGGSLAASAADVVLELAEQCVRRGLRRRSGVLDRGARWEVVA